MIQIIHLDILVLLKMLETLVLEIIIITVVIIVIIVCLYILLFVNNIIPVNVLMESDAGDGILVGHVRSLVS